MVQFMIAITFYSIALLLIDITYKYKDNFVKNMLLKLLVIMLIGIGTIIGIIDG